MDRKLVVLDVNGLMIHKVLSINDKEDINHLESYKTNKLNIYIRKGIYDFIKKLNETFDMTKDDLKILATDGECVVNDKTGIPSFLVVKSAPHMGL